MEPGEVSRGNEAEAGVDSSPKPRTSRRGGIFRGLIAGALTVGLVSSLGVWWFDVPTSVSAPAVTAAAPGVLVTQPTVLAADSITNLAVVQQSTADTQNKRAIAYVRAEGMDGLAQLVDTYVLDQIRSFDEGQTAGSRSDELNIGWELPAAAGPFLGVRLTSTVLNRLGSARTDHGTVYGDRSGRAVASRELFTEQGARTASQLIQDVLASANETAISLVPSPTHSPTSTPIAGITVEDDALLSDIVFDSTGAAFAVLRPSAGIGEGSEPVAVRIAPDVTAGLLSEAGTRIRAAHVAQEPFVGLPEPATVTADPTRDPAADLAGADPSPTSTQEAPPGENGSDAPAESAEPNPEKSPEAEKPAKKKKTKAKSSKKVNCAKQKCVALTFDDGPGPHTAKLLKILNKEKVPATFFLIGRNVNVYPDLVKTMSKQGHEVASHTWSHPDLRRLSEKKIAKELNSTSEAIKKATGTAPKLMRPPYGAIDNKVAKVLKQQGQTAILWDVDTEDWKNKNAKSTAKRAKAATKGSIVLMHDIHPSTVDAVPGIIEAYKKKGYTFVKVSELLPKTKAGRKYYRR